MTATVTRAHLAESLKTLNLSGMLDTLDARLTQAAAGDLGFTDFLQALCLDEINRRANTKLARLTKAARFTNPAATLETFDMNADPGIPAAAIRDLASLEWLDTGHLIITGAVGAGKTHLATGLGHQALRRQHTVRFTTCSRMLADLAGGHADRTWDKRLATYTRPDLLIIDDWAMRDLTSPQADDLYELVTERTTGHNHPIIITTNRTPDQWYDLFPNPIVAESLLDRLLNNAIHLRIDATSYRARQRPRPPAQ